MNEIVIPFFDKIWLVFPQTSVLFIWLQMFRKPRILTFDFDLFIQSFLEKASKVPDPTLRNLFPLGYLKIRFTKNAS